MGEQIARYTQHVAIMHNKITSILHVPGILKKNIMRLAMQYSNQLMLQDRPASFCFLSNASRITDHSRNFNETDNIDSLNCIPTIQVFATKVHSCDTKLYPFFKNDH